MPVTLASKPGKVRVSLPAGAKLSADMVQTDEDFWQVFRFRFLDGKPFTAADVSSGLPRAVIAASVARRLFGRMAEIGVRKAFGATANELMRQVFLENLLLTCLAGLLGLALSYAATFVLNGFLFGNSTNAYFAGETSLTAGAAQPLDFPGGLPLLPADEPAQRGHPRLARLADEHRGGHQREAVGGQAETREFLPVNRGGWGKTREFRPKTVVDEAKLGSFYLSTVVNGAKLGSFCPSTVVNGAKLGSFCPSTVVNGAKPGSFRPTTAADAET